MIAKIYKLLMAVTTMCIWAGCATVPDVQVSPLAQLEMPTDGYGLTPGMRQSDFSDLSPVSGPLRNGFITSAVPSPCATFDRYLVIICPSHGLVSVMGSTMPFASYGTKHDAEYLVNKYNEMSTILSTKYGVGERQKDGDYYKKDAEEEMRTKNITRTLEYMVKNRLYLVTTWAYDAPGYESVTLRGFPDAGNAARLSVAYRFSGFRECVEGGVH